jgi:amidophosphoribosyltransferase
MGGLCGVIAKDDCVSDLFFGTDYHSHLGTHRGGMCVLGSKGFQRSIHNIQNAPFRSKFERDVGDLAGRVGLGVISDTDPQPLVMRSSLGTFAITTVGLITNIEELMAEMFDKNHLQLQYSTTSGMVGPTEVVSAILASAPTLEEGVKLVQQKVKGSCSFMVVTDAGRLFVVRDRYGRTPVVIGRKDGATIALQESCALANLEYEYLRDMGPGEMVELTADGVRTVIEPGSEMAICAFLWIYYGFPASTYEGRNVEMSRYRSGAFLARSSHVEADSVCGVPDSGVSHALGFAHEAKLRYARPFIKYTPSWARSFTPQDQRQRERVAAMKLIPIPGLIKGKSVVFCDDSIVRGTQLGQQAKRLYAEGVKETHMRIACPPLLFPCKFINFSRSKSEYDLITRRFIRDRDGVNADVSKYLDPDGEPYKEMVEYIRKNLGLTSLAFQRLDDLVAAIGLPKERICTYCWDGKDISCPGCCPGCPKKQQD